LQLWKQKLGSGATYNNLIKAFEEASHKDYAENVKHLLKNVQTDTGNSSRNTTPPLPSTERPLPVFPSQFLESPSYAAAAEVKLLQEDRQLGTKEVII
jgi:hypothetical protein